MDLTQIRYFLALAETLNFTRAAEACNVSQPALTKSIQKLEDELGGPLLLRERGHSQLTELGRAMRPLLQQSYDAASAARSGASRFLKQDRARLRIGMDPGVPPDSIAPLLQQLDPKFPALELVLRQGNTGALNDWLIGGDIEVALSTDIGGLTDRANAWAIFDEGVVALLAIGHRLAHPDPLPAELLRDHPLIGRMDLDDATTNTGAAATGTAATGTAATGTAATGTADIGATLRHRGSSDDYVWTLVRAGLGIALSSARRPVPDGMVSRPLDPPRTRAIHVAVMPGRPAPAVAGAFLRLARARDWNATP